MQPTPEQDPDVPRLAVTGDGPVVRWLEESARRLGIVTGEDTAMRVSPRPEPALDGCFEAVLVVRSPHGQAVTYAVAQEEYAEGMLQSVQVPVRSMSPERSGRLQEMAVGFVTELGVVGATCLHFEPGQLAIASARIGIDASGAWTLDGALTSVYENHVRALFDLPLGAPSLRGGAVATCAVGPAPGLFAALRHCMARDPRARIHLYGESACSGRTVGHVSVVSDDADDNLRRARHAADYLTGTIEE